MGIAEREAIAKNTDSNVKAAKEELAALWKNVRERQLARKKERRSLQDQITKVQEDKQQTQWKMQTQEIERNELAAKVSALEAAGGGSKKGPFKKGNGLSWRQTTAEIAETNRKLRTQATEAEQRHAWLKLRCEELKSQGQSLRQLITEVPGSNF